MLSRREKVKNETKKAIYVEAVRLFREQGVENTPISQITDNVGIAKGTFFRYFRTKDHLILAFYREKFSALIDSLKKKNYLSAHDAFMDMVIKMAETVISEKKLFLYHGRSTIINREIAAEEKTLNKELTSYCYSIFEKYVPSIEKYDKEMYVDIILSILNASYHDWRISEGYTDLPNIIKKRTKFLYSKLALDN